MVPKKIAGILISLMFLLIAFSIVPAQAEAQETDGSWTYMVYMSGDSSLSANIPSDIQEMQTVGSDDYLDIIVLADSSGLEDSSLARIITGGKEDIPLTQVNASWGNELNLGDPSILSQFVIWTAENYPAEHYVLDLWGHGRGWSGVCPDKDNFLNCGELRKAFTDISDAGILLDIISMDACQMGMLEVAYELRIAGDYALLSEKDVPLDGWPYDKLMTIIKEYGNNTVEYVGGRIIQSYIDWGKLSSQYSLTLAFIDLEKMDELAGDLDAYSLEAANMADYFNPEISSARDMTEEYDGYAQYDIWHLMENINRQTRCLRLEALANDLLGTLDECIVHEQHWTNVQDEPADNAHGLSIWFPSHLPSINYLECSLSQDTGWPDFLSAVGPHILEPERIETEHHVEVTPVDTDNDGLNDAIEVNFEAQTAGISQIEIQGPDGSIVHEGVLDTSASGSKIIALEAFGLYSAGIYLWNETGALMNYTHFDRGLAREGISTISGLVRSNLGRGLRWIPVNLQNDDGQIITSTVTDGSGHYSMDLVIPRDTDGLNLTLLCGFGTSQTNISVEMIYETNTYDFQLDTAGEHVGWLTYIIAVLNLAGILALLFAGMSGRRTVENKPDQKDKA